MTPGLAHRKEKALLKEVSEYNKGRRALAHPNDNLASRVPAALERHLDTDTDGDCDDSTAVSSQCWNGAKRDDDTTDDGINSDA